MSNYATKVDLKGATGVYTSNIASKSDLLSIKAELNKLGIGNQNYFYWFK